MQSLNIDTNMMATVVEEGTSTSPYMAHFSDTSSTAPSDTPSARYNSGCKRLKKRPAYHGRSKSDSRGDAALNTNLILSPRPYENLYAEGAYLSMSLAAQSARGQGLLCQYLETEGRFLAETGKPRRRLHKQLGYLRAKINLAADQEKALALRLAELSVEMRSRETWTQANQQKWSSADSSCMTSPSIQSVRSQASGAMSLAGTGMSSPLSPLNGATPEFVPWGYFPEVAAPAMELCSRRQSSNPD